jgi:uncharacterized protein (TIGR03086 family)
MSLSVSAVSVESVTVSLLVRAGVEFGRALAEVADSDWSRRTPCPDWSVRNLVDHVVFGEAAVQPWLHGLQPELDWDLLASSPRRAWQQYSEQAVGALSQPGALNQTVDHPFVGPISGDRLAGFRIVDRTVHAWDLLASIGADDTLSAELVEPLYAMVLPTAESIEMPGLFAKAVEVSEAADVQTRLLALFGRSRGELVAA